MTEAIKSHKIQPPLVNFFNPFRRRIIQEVGGPSLTKQEFKDDCDINRIMDKYIRTGAIDHFSKYSPMYGEFSPCDYQESLNLVNRANKMFAELPASIRQLTETPDGFLSFVQDPKNKDKMAELGLIKQPNLVAPPPSGGASAT